MYPIGYNIFVYYSVDLRLGYQSERSNSVFFYNIQDVFRIEGMLKVFIFGAMCAVFWNKSTYIYIRSFQIVSRGDDMR